MGTFKTKYTNAIKWRNSTGNGVLEEQGQDTVDYMINGICPHFDLLDQLFGHKANVNPPYIDETHQEERVVVQQPQQQHQQQEEMNEEYIIEESDDIHDREEIYGNGNERNEQETEPPLSQMSTIADEGKKSVSVSSC